jgi:hypothetical protein
LDLGDATDLGYLPLDPESKAQQFLWLGQCPKGTRFRIWLTHQKGTTRMDELVEFRLNGCQVARFFKPGQPDTNEFTALKLLYDLDVSNAFWPGKTDSELDLSHVAQYDSGSESVTAHDDSSTFDLQESMCRLIIKRIQALLTNALSGFFYLSAIRGVEKRNEVDIESQVNVKRYVGVGGERTWDLERYFAYNRMNEVKTPFYQPWAQEFEWRHFHDPDGFVRELLGSTPASSLTGKHHHFAQAKRILDLSKPEMREQLEAHRSTWDRRIKDLSKQPLQPTPIPQGFFNEQTKEAGELLARIFNDLLPNRNLFQSECWPDIPDEARQFVRRGLENLTQDEVIRLNRLLLEKVFQEGDSGSIRRIPPFLFEGFVSYWLHALVQTRLVLVHSIQENESLGDIWTDNKKTPHGYLVDFDRSLFSESTGYGKTSGSDQTSLCRFLHNCFGKDSSVPTTPKMLSAGFHQIAPMVVQAGLMRPYEIMAIENPEVHLHPSLQIQLTEFLLQEAGIFKTIILETHSDLIVRRVMRGVLSEEIPQEQVRLYFADLIRGPAGYDYTSLRRLEVNERGEIDNWPEGFMDDDIRESRRLLGVVYGIIPLDDKGNGEVE